MARSGFGAEEVRMLGLGTLPAHAQEIMLNHRGVLGCCDWGLGFLTPKSRRILAKSCCTTAEQHILYNRSRTRPLLLSNIMTIVLTIVIYIFGIIITIIVSVGMSMSMIMNIS